MDERGVDRFAALQLRCAAGREAVLGEIHRFVAARATGVADLGAMLLDYPLRPAKALRPTLCLSVAAALGAGEAAALPSAAALELLHNAFLIHDDVEDASRERRGGPTLHELHGIPTAVNVADGMFALSLYPLLENCELLGVGPALAVLETIADTVRITVEGQALELAWIRDNCWSFADQGYRSAYFDLVLRKTAHYSFVAPVTIGCLVAGAPSTVRDALERYARHVGVAFQITDDILNLEIDGGAYGKEREGDLWEGKRTLILLHAIAHEADEVTRTRALEILARPRPSVADERLRGLSATVERLHDTGRIDADAYAALTAAIGPGRASKSTADVAELRALIDRRGSIAAARSVAVGECEAAADILRRVEPSLCEGAARRFLHDLVHYVIDRLK
ncbi:polyprenyl synthetase family protein [Nannocystis pusilla]|uniref:Polyprenyl synthetase family protein n=1 Tax=Nannocystis pusilla TaxID=889268 RepID=A0ABS7TRZ7_9BACT|nr:polyprenyl synthetase family protein [Nannocystis pusilla]MBZ5710991.1 polyprenyl synthetase family protein [Nannocystis pusilla]